MSYFDADMRLKTLDTDGWQIYSKDGAGLAAHNLTEATKNALKLMSTFVAEGDGVLTAAKRAYKHVYQTLEKYSNFGATDSEPRGVLIGIIEEYTRRRFEVEIDLYWEV